MTLDNFFENKNLINLPDLDRFGIEHEVITEITARDLKTDALITAYKDEEGEVWFAFIYSDKIICRNYFIDSKINDLVTGYGIDLILQSCGFEKYDYNQYRYANPKELLFEIDAKLDYDNLVFNKVVESKKEICNTDYNKMIKSNIKVTTNYLTYNDLLNILEELLEQKVLPFIEQEEKMVKDMVDKVAESGANVLFAQKGIDDLAQHYLSKAGILAVRRVKKSDIEKLARATGANVVTNLEDLTADDLGEAGIVEERKVSGEEMIFVEECSVAKSVTLFVRGSTKHIVDEIVRAIEDAIGVVAATVEDDKVVAGGGAPEIAMAKKLKDYADSISGREQLAVNAFAEALEIVPKTLAENAGLDSIDSLVDLRAAHENSAVMGLDVFTGKVAE